MKLQHILLTSILLFIFSTFIFAQTDSPIQTGPRLSLDIIWNQQNQSTLQNLQGVDTLNFQHHKNDLLYGLGMFMQFNVKDYFFIRPEALIHLSKRRHSLNTLDGNNHQELISNLYTFSLPIHLGYQIESLSLQVGVVWNSQLKNEFKENYLDNFDYKYQNSYTSFSIGLGYQSEWILLDLYYQKSLGNSRNLLQYNNEEQEHPIKLSYLTLRLGIILAGRN